MKHTRTHTHHHPTHPRPLAQAQTPTHSTQTPRSIHNVLFQTTLLHRINVPNTGNSSTGASSTATAKVEQTEQPPQCRNNWRSTVTTSSASYPLPQAKWVRTPPPTSLFPTPSRWTSVRVPPCPTQQKPGPIQFPQYKTKTWQQTRTLEQTWEVRVWGVGWHLETNEVPPGKDSMPVHRWLTAATLPGGMGGEGGENTALNQDTHQLG